MYALASGAADAGILVGFGAGFFATVVTGAVVVVGSAVLAGVELLVFFEPQPARTTTSRPSARISAERDQPLLMREIACMPLAGILLALFESGQRRQPCLNANG